MKKVSAKNRIKKFAFGGGGEDPKNPKKVVPSSNVFQTQEEINLANLEAKRFAKSHGHVNPEDTFVAKLPGDLKPTITYQDASGKPLDPKAMIKPLARTVPSGISLQDIKSHDNLFWYEDPHTGDIVDIDPGVVLPKFKTSPQKVKEDLANRQAQTSFANGGTAKGDALVGIAQQIPGIADALMGMFENNPRAFSKQPTVNASTMKQMVTPYSNFAVGGTAMPIEVEDDEVLESPDGEIVKMEGATHEQGGIDVVVPKGTKIYSDRVKIDGKTMQQRKLSRERSIKRLEKMLAKNPQDKLLKGSYQRTLETTQNEEQQDMVLQNTLNELSNPQQKFAAGGTVGKYGLGGEYGDGWAYDKTGWHNPVMMKNFQQFAANAQTANMEELQKGLTGFLADRTVAAKDNRPKAITYSSNPNSPNYQPEVTTAAKKSNAVEDDGEGLGAGDWLGIGGNLFNAIAPIINTNNNAAANKPNINRYLGFGKEALDTNEQSQDMVAGIRTSTLNDIDTGANSSRARNRNSASSVNTIRALDSATDMTVNKAKQSANDSFAKMMTGLFSEKGQLANMRDQVEMQGETAVDAENKADTDNYYSNMAENLVNFGTNVQGIGKAVNVNKSNRIDKKLISQLSQYGLGFDDEGNLISLKKG